MTAADARGPGAPAISTLAALASIASSLNRSADLDGILPDVLAQVLALSRFSAGLVRRFDTSTGEFVLTAQVGLSPELAADLSRLSGSGDTPLHPMAGSGVPLVVEDLLRGASAAPSLRGSLARNGFRTVVSVALPSRGALLGTLELFAPRRRALSEAARHLLTTIAGQIGMALANAKLAAAGQWDEAAEAKFRGLLESAPDSILIVRQDGCIDLVNGQAESMFGYRREELLGQPIEMLVPTRFRKAHLEHRAQYQSAPRTRAMGAGMELFARRKDGREFPVEVSLSPNRAGGEALTITVIRDITERRRAEEARAQLLASEREKTEQLKLSIREAHHRIKNNLQAITALLYLELATEGSGAAERSLRDSMERVQAIALVHDLLTQEEDVRAVNIRAVVDRLVPTVLRSSGLSLEVVLTTFEVPPLMVSSKQATALALIVNELASNAAKHAFSARRGGHLHIALEQPEGGLLLRVSDDGPGVSSDFDLPKHANVGLEVVRALVERDLNGSVSFRGGPGLVVEVHFPTQ
jgi:PAS domain S-box-containing protein